MNDETPPPPITVMIPKYITSAPEMCNWCCRRNEICFRSTGYINADICIDCIRQMAGEIEAAVKKV